MKTQTYQDPYEEEEVETTEQIDELDKIDALEDPAEIKAALEKFDKPEETEKSDTEKPPDEKDKAEPEKSDKPEEKDKIEEEKPETIIPPEIKGKEEIEKQETKKPDAGDEVIAIDEDYISKAEENDKGILRTLMGQKATPNMIKGYINAQRLVGRRAEELLKKPSEIKQPNFETQKAQTDQLETVQAEKQNYVIQQLRQKFPELEIPKDPKELAEFKRTLNYDFPDKYGELRESERKISAEVEQEYNAIVDIRENYDKYNHQKIDKAINNIYQFTENMGVKLRDLGFDLTLDSEKKSNEVINALLFDENGDADPNIIQFGKKGTQLEGIPFLNDTNLVQKFFWKHGKQIKEKIDARARNEGYKAANDKTVEKPKVLAETDTKGEKIERKTSYTAQEIEETEFTPDQISEILRNAEVK